jgi:hypothetical protein
MAKDTQNIGDLIRKLVENNEELYSLPCKVVKVSGTVAELAPLNGDANILGVKLIAGTSTTNFLITPSIDSVVIATFLSKDTAFIGLYSEIDTIAIRGDQYGGLVKVEDLVDKINRLENKVNDLITKFNSHTHITTATVSATPVPGIIAPPVTPEVIIAPTTVKADLENEEVKHG